MMNLLHLILDTRRFLRGSAQHPDLQLLSYSEEVGPFIIQSKDNKHIMITGHLEYDATTLSRRI